MNGKWDGGEHLDLSFFHLLNEFKTDYPISFPGGSDGKEFSCSAGNLFNPCLGQEDPLEKEMATHSNFLA